MMQTTIETTRESASATESDQGPASDADTTRSSHEVAEQRVRRQHEWAAYRYVERGPWTLSGILALAGGLVFGVMGLVGLARAGFDMPLTSPTVTVGWLEQTAILALGHVLLGVVLAAAGASAARERSGVLFVAGMLIVGGLVLLIEPGAFADFLGVTSVHGLTYALTGGALMAAGLFAPTIQRNKQVITERS